MQVPKDDHRSALSPTTQKEEDKSINDKTMESKSRSQTHDQILKSMVKSFGDKVAKIQ